MRALDFARRRVVGAVVRLVDLCAFRDAESSVRGGLAEGGEGDGRLHEAGVHAGGVGVALDQVIAVSQVLDVREGGGVGSIGNIEGDTGGSGSGVVALGRVSVGVRDRRDGDGGGGGDCDEKENRQQREDV